MAICVNIILSTVPVFVMDIQILILLVCMRQPMTSLKVFG